MQADHDGALAQWRLAVQRAQYEANKKVRYKGLAKNEAQLYSLFGLANLVMAKKRLLDLAPQGIGAP